MLRKRFFPTLFATLVSATLAFAASTIPIGNLTDTYNNIATTYCSQCMTISGQSYAAPSRVFKFIGGDGTVLWSMDPTGIFHASGGANNSFILNAGSSDLTILNSTVSLFGIGTPTMTFGENNNVGNNKVSLTGKGVGAPIGGAGTCGTSPTRSTNASDFMGQITTGAGATGCQVPFSATKTAAPACMVFNVTDGTMAAGVAPTTTNLVFTAGASKTYMWICNDKA